VFDTSARVGDAKEIRGRLSLVSSKVIDGASDGCCGLSIEDVRGHHVAKLGCRGTLGVKTTMTEQTPEEAEQEAQAAAAMGMDVETYREREARHSDFQPVFIGNLNDPATFGHVDPDDDDK
jgi:hypothetical protein